MLASSAYSQTIPSNTASNNIAGDIIKSDSIPADQTISFLLDQNEKAKSLIAVQEKRIADLEAVSAAEKEAGESVSKSYSLAQGEIESLRSANAALHKAVLLNERTIALLETDRNKWKDTAKKEKRSKYKAYIITAGVIALKFFIP